jgi:hypothetical protein
MVRSAAIPLVILAGMALFPIEVIAAQVIYSIVPYPSITNPYTVSGTITTNGEIGSELPVSDITSWDITITNGTTLIATFTPSIPLSGTVFDASSTAITLPIFDDVIIFTTGLNNLQWTNIGTAVNYEDIEMPLSLNPTNLWQSNLPSTTSPIATAVPEPTSAVLASIGAVVAVLAYGWSRHRRAQRRQATG